MYVIDTKHYSGRLEIRDVGGWFRTDVRLFVGGRDRSKLVVGMSRQVEAVRKAIEPLATDRDLPVMPVLCFVGVELGWFPKVSTVDGVTVAWPGVIGALVARPGPLTDAGVAEVTSRLASVLLPA